MKAKYLKITSFSSLIIIGLILILLVWGVIDFEEVIYVKIIATLGVIFFVSTMIYGVLQRDSKK